MMIDRTIPFYNTILRCDEYTQQPVHLPAGYRITSYKPGNENDWAKLESNVGDFDTIQEAKDYFISNYLNSDSHENLLFLLNNKSDVIGSCIAWKDERKNKLVNSLHWLIVNEEYQGKGLGRALCTAAMNRFYANGSQPIYIHTQPWSWKAILLYCSLGFRLQKMDTFNNYENQYEQTMETLAKILSKKQMEILVTSSADIL